MSVYAIISEFNPFHNGHKYIIDCAKARGAEAVVCVMSGNAVERGELALLDKYYRAEMALRCGADLVLELPYPWCASSAEGFARTGVRIAAEFADTVLFGSECGDSEMLSEAARICREPDFIDGYRSTVGDNVGAAEAYFELLERRTGRKYSSNDILGIEYMKAADILGVSLGFETVKRVGGGYLDRELGEGALQSATALRNSLFRDGIGALAGYMPDACIDILKKATENRDISEGEKLERAMKLFFRMKNPRELDGIAELDEGLASRICRAARESAEGGFVDMIRTKRYTDSRIRRALLFALTGVRREDVAALPAYVNLLGADSVGRALLAAKRKSGSIEVLAKSADIPQNALAQRQAELSESLDSVFSLSLGRERAVSDMLKRSPIIL